MLASRAGYKVIGFADGHGGSEIKVDTAMFTLCAGHFLKSVGHVRLSFKVEVHIGIDRKVIPTFEADPAAFPIRLYRPAIDTEVIGFANGATHARQALFDDFQRYPTHRKPPSCSGQYTDEEKTSATRSARASDAGMT